MSGREGASILRFAAPPSSIVGVMYVGTPRHLGVGITMTLRHATLSPRRLTVGVGACERENKIIISTNFNVFNHKR